MAAALTLVVAACSGGSDHGDADVAFVQGMTPHHSQAVEMSRLAPGRAASPEVTALATRIESEQGPEIAQMNDLLADWDVPPAGDMAGMGGMAGMMGPQQMAQLAALSGPAFDRAFLAMMIEHHTGAISMANTEIAQGRDDDAVALARRIVASQQAEIDEMRGLLARTAA